MTRWLSTLAIVFSLIGADPSAAAECRAWRRLAGAGRWLAAPLRFLYPSDVMYFSDERAYDALDRYRKLLSAPMVELHEPLPESIEEKAAFLQAVLEKVPLGAPQASYIDSLWGPHRWKLGKILRSLEVEQGISKPQLDSALGLVVLKDHLSPTAWRELFRNGWSETVGTHLRVTFDKGLAKSGSLALLRELHLARDPSVAEKVREGGRRLAGVVDTLAAVAGLAPVAAGEFPNYLVNYQPLSGKRVQTDIASLMEERGEEAARVEFYSRYGRIARCEILWSFFRQAYLAVVLGALVQKHYDDAEKEEQEAKAARDKVAQAVGKVAEHAQAISEEGYLIKQWAMNFKSGRGRPPTEQETEIAREFFEFQSQKSEKREK